MYVIIATVAFYLLAKLRTYKHETSLILEKANPTDVWEYVADFSNMKHLNPTM